MGYPIFFSTLVFEWRRYSFLSMAIERERIYEMVRRIPRGKVATYGQIARLAGYSGHARQVGYALSALPEANDVPWQRVINAQGKISTRSMPDLPNPQAELLEAEGIHFEDGKIDLGRYRWEGPSTSSGQAKVKQGL